MEEARELRQRGIRAAKSGQKEEARALLQQSLRLEPKNEPAWLWLASVARDNQERIFCLQKILEINPINDTAHKALEAALKASPSAAAPPPQDASFSYTPAPASVPAPAAAPQKPGIPDLMTDAPGVPVPMPDRIVEAQKQADPIVRGYLMPPESPVTWVHKTHRRAGERDIIVYRAYVAGAIIAVILVLIGMGVFVVQTNDDVKEIVFGPSATPTPSPTITPTYTPGFTPTPSATPRLTPTPSSTPPPNLLAASPPFLPRATEIYPEILERAVYESVLMLDKGDIAEALPTLEHERRLTFDTRLEPNPYYYEALAYARQGRFDDALSTLDEAAGRIEERPDNLKVMPFLDSGYAQVYWAQAQQASANSQPDVAATAMSSMSDHAQAAVTGDRRLVEPYILLAQAAAQTGAYSDAIKILNQGLTVPDLVSNTDLIMERAQVYFQQRDYERALYQAYLALYIDPTNEAAYQLKAQIAMQRSRPGDAVLNAQDYLHYYPGSTLAYRLLGEAREAEQKPDDALAAYNQGLAGNSTDADAQQMLEARAKIYHSQRRYEDALADYNRLYTLNNDPNTRAQRMRVALDAGDYDQALDDANALSDSGTVAEGIINLVRGTALVEKAGANSTIQQAASYLTQALGSSEVGLTALRADADEYLARAQLALGNEDEALNAINAALAVSETGSRHYWRGRILQAQDDKRGAMDDYEWVLSWSQIFPYPFRVDAQDRLEALTTG